MCKFVIKLPDSNAVSFCDLVRHCRTELGITQADLAERVGVSQQTIGRWERSEVRLHPRRDAIERLADVCRIAPETLMAAVSARGYVREDDPPSVTPDAPLVADIAAAARKLSLRQRRAVLALMRGIVE